MLGVPHLPGLDGAVGHDPRTGLAARGADPGGNGLYSAASAAGRRAGRRAVRRGAGARAADF